jgi:hypothetical protein
MSFCRHYPNGGMGDNTHCARGIEMRALRDTSTVPHRFPCYTAGAEHLCAKHEPHTAEEIAEEDRKVEEFLSKMTAFESRTTEACPHCGQHVDALEQVGRCVYSRPCGCRQWQGRVPAVWKSGA